MTAADRSLTYMPESALIDLLYRRHSEVSVAESAARRWACADHVPTVPFNASTLRVVDFVAMDCWKGRDGWPVHGFEVKGSRADWLAELRDPTKAEAFKRYCDRWWLVVSDERIVRPGELPPAWGALSPDGLGGLLVLSPAPKLHPEPWPKSLVAAFARAVAKSARAEGDLVGKG